MHHDEIDKEAFWHHNFAWTGSPTFQVEVWNRVSFSLALEFINLNSSRPRVTGTYRQFFLPKFDVFAMSQEVGLSRSISTRVQLLLHCDHRHDDITVCNYSVCHSATCWALSENRKLQKINQSIKACSVPTVHVSYGATSSAAANDQERKGLYLNIVLLLWKFTWMCHQPIVIQMLLGWMALRGGMRLEC